MRKLVSTKNLGYDEWLKFREKSIGGSDCATIVGLNKFKSKYTLWAEKKGFVNVNNSDTEILRQGRDFEDYVASRFCEATGKKVRKRNYIFLHDDYDFISANIDREIIGENAGLECKTTSVYNKTDFENGEIPPYYYCKCMHYMAVMGYEKMYLAVLILSKGFYWFEIHRNETEIESLVKQEKDFWERYIIGEEIPEIDGSDSTFNTVRSLNFQYSSNIKDLSKIEDILDEYTEISNQKKYISEKEKALKNNIIAFMDNSEVATSKKFKVTYKSQKRTILDTNLIKKDQPNIYNKYSKTTETRVLKVGSIN